MQPVPTLRPWTVLSALAVACLIGAAAMGFRAPLSVAAAALGTAAITTYGITRVRSGQSCAALAWLGAGCISAVLYWGLGREIYPIGYPSAVAQLVVGLALLPSHLRRSDRRATLGEPGST